jgi:hypothetical protein
VGDASLAQAGVPAGVVRELLFPYTVGAEWVSAIRAAGGTAAIDRLYADPPVATAYVVHPERLDSGWRPAGVALPPLEEVLGRGWSRESGGTLGEFQIRNYLQIQLGGGQAAIAAAGWEGDAYAVYRDGRESLAAFRLRFANADEAREFADAHAAFLAAARAATTVEGGATVAALAGGRVAVTLPPAGADVVFVISSDRGAALKAVEALAGG